MSQYQSKPNFSLSLSFYHTKQPKIPLHSQRKPQNLADIPLHHISTWSDHGYAFNPRIWSVARVQEQKRSLGCVFVVNDIARFATASCTRERERESLILRTMEASTVCYVRWSENKRALWVCVCMYTHDVDDVVESQAKGDHQWLRWIFGWSNSCVVTVKEILC